MTTDNKTLADVQPGGRVRLGDSRSTRAATFLRQYLTYLRSSPRQGLRPRWCDVYEALEIAIESLSAQPSPGGQGESVTDEMVDAACRAYYDTAEDAVDVDHTCMEAALKAALAARQPVGQELVERLVEAVEGECDGLAISRQTAGAILDHVFPLGQEPDAYMVDGRIEQGLFFDMEAAGNMATMNAGEVVPLFRWPAQAVDLGQFRAQVAALLRREFDLEVADPGDHRHDDGAEEADRIAGSIAALIESQAAGN